MKLPADLLEEIERCEQEWRAHDLVLDEELNKRLQSKNALREDGCIERDSGSDGSDDGLDEATFITPDDLPVS